MNELQQVLLVFALVVVGGLVGLNYLKNSKKEREKTRPETSKTPITPTASEEHQTEFQTELENKSILAVDQSSQSHSQADEVLLNHPDALESKSEPEPEPDLNAVESGAKHHVIYDESLIHVDEVEGPIGMAADTQPSFGKPEGPAELKDEPPVLAENRDPKVYAIIVMSAHEFEMKAIHQALLGVGLVYSDKQTYVKKDAFGQEYIHVANVMEPGYFPNADSEEFTTFKTAGVAVILPLPACVKAPAAMSDMITIARKVSQRLNGRLYDSERRILKESDIQVMRDAAIAYESVAM